MEKLVLIVDDQLGIRLLLEEIVRSEGYRVNSCENGMEALKFIEHTKPDLLFIDFWLPAINGAEVIEQIEAEGIIIPTIVMTGLVEEVKEKVTHLQSIQEILAKPFDVSKAKEHVHRMLDNA